MTVKTLDEFDYANAWVLRKVPVDFANFIEGLTLLFGENHVLYLEDGKPSDSLNAFFNNKGITSDVSLPRGNPLAKNAFSLPCQKEVLNELAILAQSHTRTEIGVHLLVHDNNEILLAAYDIFDSDIYLSFNLNENDVQKFCEFLECDYQISE